MNPRIAPEAPTRRGWLKKIGGVSVAGVMGAQLAGCGGGGSSGVGLFPPANAAEPPAPTTPGLPAKALFPGVADRVFLNGSAHHPWSTLATDALKKYGDSMLGLTGGNATAAARFAKLINADADEVTYVPSTSMGEYLVTKALGLPEAGGRVVTDALHFTGSFYMYEQYRLHHGLDVVTVPMDAEYRINMADLDRAITPGTKLVAVSYVSLYNGFTHDLKALCDLAHSRGALVYADLIQAAGAIPVDVKATGVDFAACGTYKWLMGDFGFAFLYVKKSLLPSLKRPWYGYRQTANFVSPELHVYPLDTPGSVPYVSIQNNTVAGYFMGSFPASAPEAACAASLDWIMGIGVEQIQAYRKPLTDALQDGLRARGFQVVTPRETNSPIVTFAYLNASRLAPRLDPQKIVITLRANHARLSPSVFNDMADIEKFLAAIGSP